MLLLCKLVTKNSAKIFWCSLEVLGQRWNIEPNQLQRLDSFALVPDLKNSWYAWNYVNKQTLELHNWVWFKPVTPNSEKNVLILFWLTCIVLLNVHSSRICRHNFHIFVGSVVCLHNTFLSENKMHFQEEEKKWRELKFQKNFFCQ